MRLSDMILVGVFIVFALLIHGLVGFMVVDEWQRDRRFNSILGASLLTMLDLLFYAGYLHSKGL